MMSASLSGSGSGCLPGSHFSVLSVVAFYVMAFLMLMVDF
jgi:hypothetical protein